MSKNMTRKGLALGTASALVIAGFVGTPAVAGGLADKSFVSLAPSSGTAYTVLTGASKTFSLTANEAASISAANRNLKFLVTDPDSAINPTASTTARTGYTTHANDTAAVANNVVTVTTANSTAGLAPGDLVKIQNADFATVVTAGTYQLTAVTANSFSFNFTAGDGGGIAMADVVAIEVLREARAADGSYVVDTGSATANSNETLELTTSGSETSTRTVTIEAWVDNNGNDVLDSTENASEVRTVTFKKASEMTASVTIQPQIVGTTTLSARIVTTPELNGSQMAAGDVTAKFTMQGSPTEFTASSSTWDSTNKRWNASLSRAHTINGVDVSVAGTTTLTFTANHDLTVGETIITSDLNAADNGTFVITAKPAANKVSFADASSSGADNTGTATVAIVAGAYSATAFIGATAISGKVSNAVATVAASGGSTAVTEDINNNTTIDANGDATVVARPATTSVSAVMTFKDANGVAVPAGRPVVLTATTITNATGVKVNGTTVAQAGTVNAVTAAGGTVAVTVTTTSAVANDVVKVTGVAEGVAGSSTFAQWTWTAVAYTLHDVNGAGTKRSVAKGGAYSFDFLIADQWSQPQTGSLRLQVAVTGNTVSETYPTIATGRAAVTVSDAQIGANNVQVVVTPQKLQADGTTWNGTGTASAITYTIYPAAQSGAAVTAISADASVPFPTTAVIAGDSRLVQTEVTGDGTAGTDAIEITGVVTDSVTGVVKSGAAVTVSGASSLLFVDGTRAQLGSMTLFADENGAYSVHVRSNIAQKDSVVTVSAHGGSKTIKVTFEAADDNSGTSLVIDAPATVAPGTTFVATATLKDKFGNVVLADSGNLNGLTADFKAAYSGPGLVVGTLPTKTEADGTAKVAALLGSGDKGSITVTFSYDANGDNNYADTGDLIVSKTIAIGVEEPVAKIGSFSGRVAVRVENAKGSDVSVKIGKQWYKFVAKNNNYLQSWKARKGTSVAVSVYIDGDLQNVQTITVK